jgi:hypothetical protein
MYIRICIEFNSVSSPFIYFFLFFTIGANQSINNYQCKDKSALVLLVIIFRAVFDLSIKYFVIYNTDYLNLTIKQHDYFKIHTI